MTWIKQIENVRRHVQTDPDLVAHIVRDWSITEKAGLKDLAWAMVKQGNNAPGDAALLIDRLMAFAEKEERDDELSAAWQAGYAAAKEQAVELCDSYEGEQEEEQRAATDLSYQIDSMTPKGWTK